MTMGNQRIAVLDRQPVMCPAILQTMIDVREEPVTTLDEYATIPIAFEVSSILDVKAKGNRLDEFELTEQPIATPFLKDYDSISRDKPTQWEKRFDMSNWVLFA